MKTLRATLAALFFMALMAFPAFAQDGKTGAGDDQQVPDNQQTGGGGDMVTKTFELTLNGDVPADRAFGVAYGTFDEFEADEPTDVIFCGQPAPRIGDVVVSDEDCVGDGETYTYSVDLPEGTELYFTYLTAEEGDEENTAEPFFGNITFEGPGEAEVLNADMTNTAWYTFGKGTGAGDDQQDGEDKDSGAGAGDDQQDDTQDDVDAGGGDDQQVDTDTGAGDDQQDDGTGTGTGDEQDDAQDDGAGAGDQQDDTQDDGTGAGDDQLDDTQDDQQGEMPEQLPETGAGGLASGLPLGSAAAGTSLLLACGYAVLRRR